MVSKYIKENDFVKADYRERGVELMIPITHSTYTHYMLTYTHSKERKAYFIGVYPVEVEKSDFGSLVRYSPFDGLRYKTQESARMDKNEFRNFRNTYMNNGIVAHMIQELEKTIGGVK